MVYCESVVGLLDLFDVPIYRLLQGVYLDSVHLLLTLVQKFLLLQAFLLDGVRRILGLHGVHLFGKLRGGF